MPRTPAVTVFRVDLRAPTADLRALETWLTPGEVAYASGATPAVRQRRVILRAALRRVLADAIGSHPGLVVLESTGGRPRLAAGVPGPRFSCSASATLGLVAMSWDGRLGVDVEHDGADDVAGTMDEGWLTAGERRRVAMLPRSRRPRALTRCWTQKEAVLKARGTGLHDCPSSVPTTMRRTARPPGWWVAPVPVPAGYVASVAVRAGSWPDITVEDLTWRVGS